MKTLIFDLDGTLIDSAKVVYPAFRSALRHFPHHPMPSESVMARTFGMPDYKVWAMLMPAGTPDERREANRLSDNAIGSGLFDSDVTFTGAHDVLDALKHRGYTLTVASNCGVQYLEAVLDSQGLRHLFDAPLCLEAVHGRVKADILTAHFQNFPREGAWMIGDRASDIEAATTHGIPAIGCALGAHFGDIAELKGAKHIIHNLNELLTLFPA